MLAFAAWHPSSILCECLWYSKDWPEPPYLHSRGVNFVMLLAKESSNHMSTMLTFNKDVRVQPLG